MLKRATDDGTDLPRTTVRMQVELAALPTVECLASVASVQEAGEISSLNAASQVHQLDVQEVCRRCRASPASPDVGLYSWVPTKHGKPTTGGPAAAAL